jgi:PAS domain S-box-containing protein
MKYKFSEIVDISKLQKLMEGFYSTTNILSAVLDSDANILIAVGWQGICTKFHRTNKQTELLCKQSDLYIKKYIENNLDNCESANICYTCANGLVDVAAPIIIDGEHLATVYTGQFLFEEPNIEQFREQAKKYGFNEEEYVDALKKVPIYTKEKVYSIMNYVKQIAEMLVQMGLAQLRLIESQKIVLQENEERLNTIINNTPNVAIQSYDENGKIKFINRASEIMFGWTSEVVGKTINQLVHNKEMLNRFIELKKIADEVSKPVEAKEWSFRNKEGTQKSVLTTIFTINLSEGKREFIYLHLDITEKKRLEKEMHRLEQLNLIGQMAAGIGHEVRNPMTTVRGLLQLLGNKNIYQKDKKHFALMIEEIDRANSIITEFLSLAKNKAISLEIKNLNSVILILCPLIESIVREFDLDLKLDLGEIPDLLIDEKEIRQLILNLVKNGIEAMPLGGCLTIRTYKQNDKVVLEVEDQGEGISSKIIDKIGIPFFTTKENGTGLGLATCYSIAARQNAKISVESTRGKTTFSVCFNISVIDSVGIS